jgi:hypothetical protein
LIYGERGSSAWLGSVAILFLAEIMIARVYVVQTSPAVTKPGLLRRWKAPLGNSIASLFLDLSYPRHAGQRLLAEQGRALVRDHRPARDLAGSVTNPEELIRRIEAVAATICGRGRSPGHG